ncbi:MAG: RNA-binding protein [Bacteroidetes bacterium]|nr:RNA-binding protein [Bacteroidota bacterium]
MKQIRGKSSAYGLSLRVIFIGNLPYSFAEPDLTAWLSPFGDIREINLVRDRISGRSRGFAFVALGSEGQESAAIEALDGMEIQGRKIRISKKQDA